MATRPTPNAPNACLKCATPMVPNAAFCGTCGTPAGSTGTPPLPPMMPARPIGLGAKQVSMSGDSSQALQAAAAAVPAAGGEITHQGPAQLGIRMGNLIWGRVAGTIDAFPEAPGRTTVRVSLKPDYSSLVPGVLSAMAAGILFYVIAQASLTNAQLTGQIGCNMMTGQCTGAGFFAFFQPWMIFILIVLGAGLHAWMLSGPMLEKKRTRLINVLQSYGAAPQQVGGVPQAGGFAPQGFAPQVAPQFGAQAGTPAGPPQVTPFEQLRKLAELRDAGAISAADYDQAKAAILARM